MLWNDPATSAGSASCARRMWRRSAARTPRWASCIPPCRPQGVKVPNGFALTAAALSRRADGGRAPGRGCRLLLQGVGGARCRPPGRERGRGHARSSMPPPAPTPVRAPIAEALPVAGRASTATGVAVAVRSSATAEDLPTASFAGQHESFLNVRGPDELFEACRQCFASVFTDRAIVYRNENGFDHLKIGLSVGVMKMVRSDMAASGVVFTLDTESGFPRRRLRHRRLGPGREHRPGQRRSRRILCPQADLPAPATDACCDVRWAASSAS